MGRYYKKNNGIIINNNYWVPNEGYIKAEKKSNMNVINVKMIMN